MLKVYRLARCVAVMLAFILRAFPSLSESVIYPTAPEIKLLKASAVTVDVSNLWQGYIMVRRENNSAPMKATLTRNDRTYQFDLGDHGEYETLALTEGNGSYTISVYEQTENDASQYRRVLHDAIDVFMPNPLSVFLIPNQFVRFTEESAVVAKSDTLCAGAKDPVEKANILYRYVSERILYDYVKAATVAQPYLPDPDETLGTGRGICFDTAVLLTGMLRAQGIPAQLVVGKLFSNNPPLPHAWTKVLLDDNWVMMDPTFKLVAPDHPEYREERVY